MIQLSKVTSAVKHSPSVFAPGLIEYREALYKWHRMQFCKYLNCDTNK